jgi:p-hydroxybenzoate 3-monooxygenase
MKRTQVAIVGAGPAGLMLSHLLARDGIECVVLEVRSRQYCEERVRAGVLEQGTVDLLRGTGVGSRLDQFGLEHHGLFIAFNGNRHRIDLKELTGKCITVYAQHEVVRDLISARIAAQGDILFEASNVAISQLESHPVVRYRHEGCDCELRADFICGCDGFRGICRTSIPANVLRIYERDYPFAWLGILAEAAPSSSELVYTHHPRGFALFSMRTPTVTRLYLQCGPDESAEDWSDDRIWSELLMRLTSKDGWAPNIGPILHKGVTPMRSFVSEPMRCGNLFLAGDAAHIVPPTGAKGLNLAIADVRYLAEALAMHYQRNDDTGLDTYSDRCLRRVWKVQRFSWWMTSMLHRFEQDSEFDHRRQIAELDYLTSSTAAMTTLAENYVGLPDEPASGF